MKKALFTEKQTNLATVLAGQIPSGIMFYKNYLSLGQSGKAHITLAITFVVTTLYFYFIFILPPTVSDKIPNFIFTAFYAVPMAICFRLLMHKAVVSALETGQKKASNWSVAGVTILGILINLCIVFLFTVNQPFYEGETIQFGGNTFYYNAKEIPAEVAEKATNCLVESDFFGEDYENIAKIGLANNQFLITLVVDAEFWDDPDAMAYFSELKKLFTHEFQQPVLLQLESVSLAGNNRIKPI